MPIPDHVDRLSLAGEERRPYLYGEHGENQAAMRMIRQNAHKLIYYPVGNRKQLFDIDADPLEIDDLAEHGDRSETLARLEKLLVSELYGNDLGWVKDGELVGLPDIEYTPSPDRNLRNQRGLRFM